MVSDGLDLRAFVIPILDPAPFDPGYGEADLYRDLRAVLLPGSPPDDLQKKRVLSWLLAQCELGEYVADTKDVNATFKRLGKQEVGLDLLKAMTTEPEPEGGIESEIPPGPLRWRT